MYCPVFLIFQNSSNLSYHVPATWCVLHHVCYGTLTMNQRLPLRSSLGARHATLCAMWKREIRISDVTVRRMIGTEILRIQVLCI